MKERANSLAVIGAQWGDEGKGKIVDYLASRAQVVARYQGGNNAGHTVMLGEETFKMHHLPVGVLYEHVHCFLGNGMVINPRVLVEELENLRERGKKPASFYISEKAHVILPFHQALDEAEETRRGKNKIGTTGLGIGPAYASKAGRQGLRMMDFVDPDYFRRWLQEFLPEQNYLLDRLYSHPGFTKEEILEGYLPLGEKLAPYVGDVSRLLLEHLQEGDKVIFEGAQGTLLDVDHGTYPYVTSSSTVAGGIPSGLGISLHSVGEIWGVIKAYTTRVGEGPFPTEDTGETGNYMRDKGKEYGTTTGRPRRCGWFDAVVACYTVRTNGITGWAVTKLDVLGGLERLYIASSYRFKGKEITSPPLRLEDLSCCEPIYQELEGWEEDISAARNIKDLPAEARRYLEALEDITGVPVTMISVGPEREQTIAVPPNSF